MTWFYLQSAVSSDTKYTPPCELLHTLGKRFRRGEPWPSSSLLLRVQPISSRKINGAPGLAVLQTPSSITPERISFSLNILDILYEKSHQIGESCL